MNMGQRSPKRKLFIPIDTFNFVAAIKIIFALRGDLFCQCNTRRTDGRRQISKNFKKKKKNTYPVTTNE